MENQNPKNKAFSMKVTSNKRENVEIKSSQKKKENLYDFLITKLNTISSIKIPIITNDKTSKIKSSLAWKQAAWKSLANNTYMVINVMNRLKYMLSRCRSHFLLRISEALLVSSGLFSFKTNSLKEESSLPF